MLNGNKMSKRELENSENVLLSQKNIDLFESINEEECLLQYSLSRYTNFIIIFTLCSILKFI